MQAEAVLSLLFDATPAVDDEAVARSVNAAASSKDEDDDGSDHDDAWLKTFATACRRQRAGSHRSFVATSASSTSWGGARSAPTL